MLHHVLCITCAIKLVLHLREKVSKQRQLQDEEGGDGHGEALFQRFMVHHAHTRQRAGRAEGEGEQKKRPLRNAPAVLA